MQRMFMSFWVLLLLNIGSFSANDRDEAVLVAQKGYKEFLAKCLTPYAKSMYGLSDEDKVESATLGEPFRLFELSPDVVRNSKSNDKNLGIPVNSFLFPVKFNGVVKLILTVDKYPGRVKYEIGSLGNRPLADEIRKILDKYPRERGFTPVLYQNFQTQYYSFSIPQLGDNLTVIKYDKRNNYEKLTSVSEAIDFYKSQLKQYGEGGKK